MSSRIVLLKKGRRIEKETRQVAVNLIRNATKNGCRQRIVCKDLKISEKTFNRWIVIPEGLRNGPLTTPANKLSEIEKKNVINTANSEKYFDLPPLSNRSQAGRLREIYSK